MCTFNFYGTPNLKPSFWCAAWISTKKDDKSSSRTWATAVSTVMCGGSLSNIAWCNKRIAAVDGSATYASAACVSAHVRLAD